MTETITRIQFAPGKATIYSQNGVLAIWKGKPAAVLSAMIVDAVRGITAKLEEESRKPSPDDHPPDDAGVERLDGEQSEQA